ncbi:serine-rich adhesin for platelets isoform X1 [Drosophila grimshawi]|uniref:serine-rich adhesin for platelets isoform X1 n=1 Tax=Drosophila grimshawi TaxID=7222 RepID=UPI000C86EB5B|nr:serine-rich adhesin for platelets isoform X1 [Drosophila grimshawi]
MDKTICAIVEYEYAAKEPDELDLHKGAILHRIKQMPGGWWQGTLKANGITGMFPDNFVRVLEPSSNGNHSDDSAVVQLREKSATSNRRCKVIYSYTQVNDDELTLAVGDVIEFLGEVEEGWWRGRLRSKVGVFPSNFVRHIEPSPILASKRPPTIGATVTTAALTAKAANIATTVVPTNTTTTTAAAPAIGAATTTAATSATKQTKSRATASTNATTVAAATAATVASAATAAVAAPTLPPKPQRDYCRVEFPYAPQNEDELELKVDDIISVVSMELPDKGWWKGELRGKVGVFPDNFVKLLAPSEAPPPLPPPRPRARPRTRSGGTAPASASASASAGWGQQRGGGGSFEFLGARMASFITTIFAPINEQQAATAAATTTTTTTQRKINNTSHMTTTNATNNSSSSSSGGGSGGATVTQQQQQQSSTVASTSTSKVYIKKTGSSSNSSSSAGGNRKESFGSRDSLNDILSETGLPIGTVAAQRKSLENKNLDLSKLPGSKQQIITTTTATSATSNMSSSSSSNTTTTAAATAANTAAVYAELRKSLDNMDEKIKSSTPPVVGKKPSVPLKKTPTGSGSILGGSSTNSSSTSSGMKKKSAESNKLTSTVSQDIGDGLSGSKLGSGGHLADSGLAGNVVMRRAATIAVEDTDFDRVERGSILPDMRAGRVKAPRRRPPSAAVNVVLGESNNNNTVYVNGSSASELSEDGGASSGGKQATAGSSDDNSTSESVEPQLAKPKPRDWEKKAAPWMQELKASQETRKKTTPSVEPRAAVVAASSKMFATEQATASAATTTTATTTSAITTATSATSSTSKVQSSAVSSSSIMQQSMFVESSNSSSTTSSSSHSHRKEFINHNNNNHDAPATRTKAAIVSSDEESRGIARPNSLSIRSKTPLDKMSLNESPAATAAIVHNNHQAAAAAAVGAAAVVATESMPRVQQLEGRVEKLESMVLTQQRTIEELVRTLREEAERVKLLRGELDKYAQQQTRRGKFDNWMF